MLIKKILLIHKIIKKCNKFIENNQLELASKILKEGKIISQKNFHLLIY